MSGTALLVVLPSLAIVLPFLANRWRRDLPVHPLYKQTLFKYLTPVNISFLTLNYIPYITFSSFHTLFFSGEPLGAFYCWPGVCTVRVLVFQLRVSVPWARVIALRFWIGH